MSAPSAASDESAFYRTEAAKHGSPIDETACVLCQLFPEQVSDHARLHHKFDIQDGKLVELPIEPPPDKESA